MVPTMGRRALLSPHACFNHRYRYTAPAGLHAHSYPRQHLKVHRPVPTEPEQHTPAHLGGWRASRPSLPPSLPPPPPPPLFPPPPVSPEKLQRPPPPEG